MDLDYKRNPVCPKAVNINFDLYFLQHELKRILHNLLVFRCGRWTAQLSCYKKTKKERKYSQKLRADNFTTKNKNMRQILFVVSCLQTRTDTSCFLVLQFYQTCNLIAAAAAKGTKPSMLLNLFFFSFSF